MLAMATVSDSAPTRPKRSVAIVMDSIRIPVRFSNSCGDGTASRLLLIFRFFFLLLLLVDETESDCCSANGV